MEISKTTRDCTKLIFEDVWPLHSFALSLAPHTFPLFLQFSQQMEALLPEDDYLDRRDLSSNNLYHSHHAHLLPLSVSFSLCSITLPS